MLNLKILLVSSGKAQTMRFALEASIAEVCKNIREKAGEGGDDHGLFQPPFGKTPGRWLKLERSLQFYDMQPGTELHFKKKHRNAKIKLLDGTIKTIVIDESSLVKEIVDEVAKKLMIMNSEEYSFQVEGKTGWLNPEKTLHENLVPEDAILFLKKKFHFTDQNVDAGDPIQLHLLYVQCRDGVIKGDYPTEKEEAIGLAALQMQIQLGNFQSGIHKIGYFANRLNEWLPAKWCVDKTVEKDVLRDYSKYVNFSETNAKFRYVQVVRGLKTYGITTYIVEQAKKKGNKTKLTKIILGVTKDAILRMDFKTKEVMSTHNITQVRRWAATDKTFTLDFGDYQDEYMTFVTNEGDAISQLVGGYIDIILKRKRDIKITGNGDDSLVANEEKVAPLIASVASITSNYFGPGYWGDPANPNQQFNLQNASSAGGAPGRPGTMARASHAGVGKPGVAGVSIPITDLPSALASTSQIASDLSVPGAVPRVSTGLPLDQLKQNYGIAATQVQQNIGVLVGMVGKSNVDKNQVQAIGMQVGTSTGQLVTSAKGLAAEYDGDSLLDAARAVAEAISSLLAASQQLTDHPNDPEAKMQLDMAQERFKAAMNYMNQAAAQGMLADQGSQDLITETAKILNAIAQKMANAANVAADPFPEPKKGIVKFQAKKAASSGKNCLVAVKATVPAVTNPEVKKQLAELGEKVGTDCGQLVEAAKINGAPAKTNDELNNLQKELLNALKQYKCALNAASGKADEDLTPALKNIAAHVAQLQKSSGNPKLMVGSTKAIALASNDLVNGARTLANNSDNEPQQKALKQGANDVSDKTQKLVNHAKLAAANPNNSEMHNELVHLATDLQQACQGVAQAAKQESQFSRLAQLSKSAAASSSNLYFVTQQSAEHVDPNAKEGMTKLVRDAQDPLARMIAALSQYNDDPKSLTAQNNLVDTLKKTAPNSMSLVAGAKSYLGSVQDDNLKYSLAKAADSTAKAIQSLISSLHQMEKAQDGSAVQEAQEAIADLQADLDVAHLLAKDGLLQNPGQSREDATELLTFSINNLNKGNAKLQDASRKGPEQVGVCAKEVASLLAQVIEASKAAAGTLNDKAIQGKIIDAAKKLASDEGKLIVNARNASVSPQDKNLQNLVDASGKKVNNAGNDLLNAAKGLNFADIDDSIGAVQKDAARLRAAPDAANYDPNATAESLAQAARALAIAINELVNSAKLNPQGTGAAAKMTSAAFAPLIAAANNAASATKEKPAQDAIISEAHSLGNSTAQTLNLAKISSASHSESDILMLAQAAKQVSDSIDNLIILATPGKRELAVAKTTINSAVLRLRDVQGGQLNLDQMNSATKALAAAIAQIVTASRSNPAKLGDLSRQAATSINDLISSATDGGDEYVRYCSLLRQDIETLKSNPNTQQLLAATKSVGVNSQGLLGAARKDAGAIQDPARKQALLNAAKDLANATSSTAVAAKAVIQDPKKKSEIITAASQLEYAVDKVMESRTESNLDDSGISSEGKRQVIAAIKNVSNQTAALINASANLSSKPKDAQAQAQLTAASQGVGEAIAQLMGARNAAAPGARECDLALESIGQSMNELDTVSLGVVMGDLSASNPTSKNHSQAREDLNNECKNIAMVLQQIMKGSSSPDQIAKASLQLRKQLPDFVQGVKDAASTTSNKEIQKQIVALAKDLLDSCSHFISASKDCAADSANQAHQKQLQEKAKEASESLAKIVTALKTVAVSMKELDEAIAAAKSAAAVFDQVPPKSAKPLTTARSELQKVTKDIATNLQLVVSSARVNPERLNGQAKNTTVLIGKLVECVKTTAGASTEDNVRKAVLQAAKAAALAVSQLLADSKNLVIDQKNPNHQKQVTATFATVNDALSNLLSATRAADVGERDAEAVSSQLNNLVSDLDASALFAVAGELDVPLDDKDTYELCEKRMVDAAKNLIEASKRLAAATNGNQTEVSAAVKALGESAVEVARNAKKTAVQIPDTLTQQELLTAAKAVCLASQSLVINTAEANRGGDASAVPTAQKSVDSNASNLVNVAKTAAAEAAKGIKELELSKASITQETTKFSQPGYPANPKANAEDVVKAVRNLSAANAHLSSAIASGNPEDLVKAAQLSRESVQQLLSSAKGAQNTMQSVPLKQKLNKIALETAESTAKLLDSAKGGMKTNNPGAQKDVAEKSQALVGKINDVVAVAREMPGGAKLQLVEDFGEDLDEVAEKELVSAARIIENAAKFLLNTKPAQREVIPGFSDQTEIVEAILDAARAITASTSGLLRAATEAQKLRLQASRDSKNKNMYHKDPTWANGLISASKAVAAATQHMTQVANRVAQGAGDEETNDHLLMAAAKEVAKATAQLVSASRAKLDANSGGVQGKLSDASKSVAMSTNALMNAARTAMDRQEEVKKSQAAAKGATDEKIRGIEQSNKILKLEKELEDARREMLESRKKVYGK